MIEEIKSLPLARNIDGEEMVVFTMKQRDWVVMEIGRLKNLLLRVTENVNFELNYGMLRKEIEEVLKEK